MSREAGCALAQKFEQSSVATEVQTPSSQIASAAQTLSGQGIPSRGNASQIPFTQRELVSHAYEHGSPAPGGGAQTSAVGSVVSQ